MTKQDRAGRGVGKKRDKQSETAEGRVFQSASARRANLIIVGLAVVLVIAACVSLLLGRFSITPGEAIQMLLAKVFPIAATWTPPG